MKARSAQNKGLRFVNHLVEQFRAEVDDKTARTSGSGNGLDKNDIRLPILEWEIEAKNAETISLVKDWEQLRSQCRKNEAKFGALAIRNPKKAEFEETFIVIELHDFIELLRRWKGEVRVESNFDNDLKWKIRRMVENAKEVIKELE